MRGDGRTYRRTDSPKIWIQYSAGGRTFREVGGRTEAEARRKLRARLAEIRGDRFTGPDAQRPAVEALLDLYVADMERRGRKSVRTTLCHLKPVREFFAFRKAEAITPSAIRQYQQQRLGEGKANGTVNREVLALKQAMNFGVREKMLASVPHVSLLKEAPPRQGFFEPSEVKALAERLPEPLGDMVRFGFLSAWRYSEIRKLAWEHVSRGAGEVRLPDTKNGRPRLLPLEGWLAEIIERRWQAREYQTRAGGSALSAHVFHRGGRPVSDMRKAWRRGCEQAGLPVGRLFHDLRRSGVRVLVRSGVSRSVAMELTGHVTESTFRRYDITDDRDRREALRRAQEYSETAARTVRPFEK